MDLKRYIQIILEAESKDSPDPERKTKTRTRSNLGTDFGLGAQQDQPLAPIPPQTNRGERTREQPTPRLKVASQQQTLQRTRDLATPDMADMLGRLRDIEISPDLEAYPEPDEPETLPSVEVKTKNLPAVASQALMATGMEYPEFHRVSNLRGNMSARIRQLGTDLFGSLTRTPTKNIVMVANFGGQGPNTIQEVNAVAGYVKKHGTYIGEGEIDLTKVFPGYKPEYRLFSAAGIRWMLVKDKFEKSDQKPSDRKRQDLPAPATPDRRGDKLDEFTPQYIYCWPESDSLDQDNTRRLT